MQRILTADMRIAVTMKRPPPKKNAKKTCRVAWGTSPVMARMYLSCVVAAMPISMAFFLYFSSVVPFCCCMKFASASGQCEDRSAWKDASFESRNTRGSTVAAMLRYPRKSPTKRKFPLLQCAAAKQRAVAMWSFMMWSSLPSHGVSCIRTIGEGLSWGWPNWQTYLGMPVTSARSRTNSMKGTQSSHAMPVVRFMRPLATPKSMSM
mmetsp:Transcript_17835/g.40344  ORF Transcript_17835/g.40344 Transcript_17835/m.40344 type:complete len:207 (+) Transcript_17835:3-623(+)